MTEFNPGGATSLNQAVKLRYEANPDTNAFTDAAEAKLDGIAAGATVNATDAQLRDRATHTGAQAIATVTGLQAALDGKAALAHGHVVADVTGLQAALDGKAALAHTHGTAGIDDNAVTYAKLQDVSAASRLIGRGDSGVGDPQEIILGAGLTMTGTTLSADGGGGSPGGATGEVQFNSAGAFAGAADVEIEGGQLRLPTIAIPASPAAGGLKIFSRAVGGSNMLAALDPDGIVTTLQPHFALNNVAYLQAVANGTTFTALGLAAPTVLGTATAATVTATDIRTLTPRVEYLVTTAATTAIAGARVGSQIWTVGGPASPKAGGFRLVIEWGPATGQTTGTKRAFAGMKPAAAPTDVDPSTIANLVGMGFDTADTNIQIMHRGAGAVTKIDLGASFPKPSADRSNWYRLSLSSPPGSTQRVDYEVVNIMTGAVATGSITTNLPATSVLLAPQVHMSVGGTSSVIGIALGKIYIEADYGAV